MRKSNFKKSVMTSLIIITSPKNVTKFFHFAPPPQSKFLNYASAYIKYQITFYFEVTVLKSKINCQKQKMSAAWTRGLKRRFYGDHMIMTT